jgi:two-component system, chemotaxis family, sensor kinase CheA
VSVLEVFARFPRLVREVARQTGKQVELLVDDGGAEIDRTLVEAVADPLLHLVRNAIDHGLEDETTRRALGKPAAGHLQLRATRDGDALMFEVRDDGRGLDRKRIRERALERGLVSAAQILNDDDIQGLICTPGFSTARDVSDLSGRGVGMDVVKSRVQDLRGELLIRSEPGRGTQMVMRVPMTLALLDAYLVRAGSLTCAIPAESVAECLDAPTQNADHTLSWRGQWLPAVALSAEFGGVPPNTEVARRRRRRSALVVRCEDRHWAVVVDCIVRRMAVLVRPLDPLLAACEVFNGCAVLEDGEVALLLNPIGLAKHARQANKAQAMSTV